MFRDIGGVPATIALILRDSCGISTIMADLFKILKELKNIQPDPNYSKRSRFLILQSARRKEDQDVDLRGQKAWLAEFLRILYPAKLAFVVSIVILILAISGGIYYINNQLNQKDLVVKASEMNASIQIKLNEIKYLLENQPQVDPAKISTIQGLLEKATNELKEVSVLGDKNLDESLRKIKSSQEILEQVDALLKQ